MEKTEAINLLKQKLKNQNLQKHCLAVGSAMVELADFFGKDKQKWEVCGLLHDIDYEQTKDNPEQHSKVGSEMLKEKGLSDEVCEAVYSHNEIHGVSPKSLMGKALYCVDPLTGLIVAATLVLPSKKINDLEVENVLNRFGEKSFAKGANREIIKKCENYLNLSLEKFVGITLKAMQDISDDLGL